MKTQLLRSGFMIALASNMKGGVEYILHEADTQVNGPTVTKRRESSTTVFDVEEHERAVKVRGAALYQIRKFCVKTPFCLLCPEANEAELQSGVDAAKKLVDEFNDTSVFTKINLYVLKARLMGNDEQAAQAIAGEMRVLFEEMANAVKKMDPEKIREAITKADEVSQMLVEEQQEKVTTAIALARVAAREMTKTIKKKGLGAVNIVQDYKTELLAIEQAGKAFLDFEEPAARSPEEEIPGVQVRDLDLGETADPVAPIPVAAINPAPSLDL